MKPLSKEQVKKMGGKLQDSLNGRKEDKKKSWNPKKLKKNMKKNKPWRR